MEDYADITGFAADLDTFDLDFDSFEGSFPSDSRVEDITEVQAIFDQKYDDVSSLSSCSQTPKPNLPPEKKKTTKPKAARKFVDLINEESVVREQGILDEVTNKVQSESKVAKMAHASSIPKPVGTDIRKFYPRMFMNSINSGDLMNVQNYFNTFMTGPCKFIAKHQISSTYGMPQQMTAVGPQFFSHYLLGCFVTFPDMVLKLIDSRVITSADWVGTKIVMDTEVNCTKIYDMQDYPWVPEVDSLSELYEKMCVHAADQGTSGDNNAGNAGKAQDPAPAAPAASAGSSSGASNGATSSTNVALTRIPQTYVEKLISEATLMRVPQPLVTKGTITLYLDEHNCMQHIVVDLVQQNKLPRR